MSTIAERLSIFSVLNLGFKAIRSRIKPLLIIGFVGFLLPLILSNLVSWVIGVRGVDALSQLMAEVGPNDSMIAAIAPFAVRWVLTNLATELLLGSWIIISYLFVVRILLDYFLLRKTNLREAFKQSVGLFFRKILIALLVAVPILVLMQVTVFLGLFLLFMMMMLPVLIQVRSESGFRSLIVSVFLIYAREMKLSRLEVGILLMSLGGLLMFVFYGFEYALNSLKHLDVYYAVPGFLVEPRANLRQLNILTLMIEVLEALGLSALLTVLAGATVSAYAKMEQESVRRELKFGALD